MGAQGPEPVALAGKLAGRKVVIFGLPGAYVRDLHHRACAQFHAHREKSRGQGRG